MTDTIRELLETLEGRMSLTDLVDIVLVAGAIHVLLKLIEGRRASQMAFGTVIVGGLLVLTGSSQLGLATVQWIVRNTLPYVGIAIIVLYQAEIRIGLARIGGGGMFLRRRNRDPDPQRGVIDTLVEAAAVLSRSRFGAIVVWQGKIGLKSHVDSGVALDAKLSAELLVSLFHPSSPLHDGAVIVSGDRIVASRCVLPLSGQETDRIAVGTRHRAALGVTEETDATVLVVSEETGHASVVSGGRIVPAADRADLGAQLARSRAVPAGDGAEDGGASPRVAPLALV